MAYVQVPKDLTRVKTKVMFNLTKRQLICFALAAVTGVPFYLLSRTAMGQTLAACLMILIMLPFFFFAMYEKDGQPLEKVLMNIYRQKFQRPGIRVYRTRNMYRVIQDEIYDKEVLGIESFSNAVKKKQRKTGDKRSGKTAGKS